MRRSLLNKLNTPKALHLALVLITLFLLPSTAWGEDFQSGEYNSTNSTWGDWNLNFNPGDGVSIGDHYQLILTVAAWNSKTVTITLPKPSEGTYVIQNIYLEIPSSDYLSIQTATMNGEDISTKFSLDNPEAPQANTYTPDPPIDWTGDIAITLVGNNSSSGSEKSFVLTSASVRAVTKNTATFSWPDAPTSANDYDVSGISKSVDEGTGNITLSGHCKEGTKYSFALTPSDGTHTINYTSSDPDHAAIDETTGVVTIRQTGAFTISAELTTDGVYYSTNLYSYTLNITEIDIPYNLTVAGVEVTSANKDNVLGDEGKTVKFTPATGAAAAILYLNNATITGNIEWDMDNALTIQLTGGNTVDGYISSYNNSVALTFTYPDGSNNSYLTVGGNAVSKAISGFNSVTLAEGLSYEENAFYNSNLGVPALQYYHDAGDVPLAHISYDYGLSVAGVEVRSTNKDNVLNDGGKVKFTPATPATLTLTDATINGGITWNTDADLTVEIIGSNNTITTSSGSCFNSTHSDKTISFTRGDTNNASKLVLNASTNHVISGFSNYEAPTVTDMFWIPTITSYIISATITSSLLGGGAGTESSPLVISTFDHLKDFATYVNIGTLTTEYVQLADNLDCSGKTGFEPIGNGSNPFKGTFDGNGKTIKTLQYSTTSTTTPVGLFGTINGGTVKNLTLSNCSLSGGSGTGAIVGNFENGTLSNNFYDADVTVTNGTTTKSGQTQRGIGNGNDVIGQVELAGTKKVTVEIISFAGSNWSCNAVEGTYYTYTSTSTNYIYYVLPGCNFTFSMKPKNGYKPRFALSDDAIEVTDVEKTENEAYDHTEFTFTMPSDDLEVIWSYPIDLAADNITATIDNANYTGEAIVPTTVKVIGAPGSVGSTPSQLTKDTDFTIKGYKLNGESVDSPVDIGTYTVTIEGTGNYIGTQDVSYEIIKAYALKINGTQLNAKNIDDFYDNETVKFTPATETEPTNTLTLNRASVTGTIESGLGDLTIKLIGSNTIQGNGSSLITSLNGGTLTFDSDGTTISLLEFKDASGNVFPNDPISGFAEVKYGWVEYVESEGSKKVCTWDIEILKNGTSYRIYDGNKDHILGEGDESVKYSHDATNGHVITLNNAEVNCIWTDIHADITIALNGTNRVIDTGRTYAIYSKNGKINFVKAEGATSAELTATCGNGNGYVPIEYGSITLGEGLYWKPFYADANATVKSTVITDDPQFVIVGDRVITNGQTISGIQGSISYSESEGEKVLTLTNYVETFGSGHGNMNAIETGVTGLKVKLVGDNYISCGDNGAYAFKGTHDNASIQFIKEGSDSKLTMTTSSSNPLSFGSGKVTYDGLIFLPDADKKYICEPTAPTMSLDNEKVKLTKDYDDGTIYYSIAYADDTPSETGVKYTEPFAITHPGVVTAWVEANNATTSTVTGKHFAYQDAPYTMAINGIKTPTLLPTIAEGDVISLQRYASEDEDIASFIDGLITAKKPGTVTLSAILMPGDNTPFKVLNPVSDPNAPNEHTVSFSVYVGENLSNYFEGSNEFGTFYNEDSEIYAVPQGMKAYVVTGVSGSKLVTVETTVLPPNTVVLLDKAEGISFTKVPSEGAAPGGNLLKHATAEVSVTTESSLYVLYNDTYVKATAGSPIPTGKNYLDLSPTTNAGTRGFYNIIGEDDGSTGISEVKSEGVKSEKRTDDKWFDLQGRRLSAKPTKSGLYLHNGIKVVIK